MIIKQTWAGNEYYWTPDSENIIDLYGLTEFEHVTPEQMKKAYYGMGKDLLDACKRYRITKPSKKFLGTFYHQHKEAIIVFHFEVKMDNDVWVKMTGPQDMDFIVSGVDPSDPTWNKMARIR